MSLFKEILEVIASILVTELAIIKALKSWKRKNRRSKRKKKKDRH